MLKAVKAKEAFGLGVSQNLKSGKNQMLRSLFIAAAFAAMALPAAAESVSVDISGLDAAAAHAKIEQAAEQACRVTLSDEGPLVQYYNHDACIADAVAKAESQLAESHHTLAKL